MITAYKTQRAEVSTEAIRLYCGLCEMDWNHQPTAPGPYACISPVYGKSLRTKHETRVRAPPDTQIIQDSGAFCDGPGQRLSVEAACERQIAHAEKYGYADQITHRASYDYLIDEKWQNGIRYTSRWSELDAEDAVAATIQAAAYLSSHRSPHTHVILSAQGVSATQYLRCVQKILPYVEPGDMLGFGGWCILGKMPAQFLPVFYEVLDQVIPFLSCEGVKHIHIWGVCYAKALGELLWMCDEYGITLSTDSVGPQLRPAFGRWGYIGWINPHYKRPPVRIRGLARAAHVCHTRRWLAHFRETPHYQSPLKREGKRQLLLR